MSSLLAASPVAGQLRPLEPVDWAMFRGTNSVSFRFGASRLDDQRASLAGTRGVLWEAGNFSVAWRTGRVMLEAGGTAQRFFDEKDRFSQPYAGVTTEVDGTRHDSGDYRVSTAIRLTSPGSPVISSLRFGTRLPTTDNTTGLDRDAIDFFALVGAARSFSRLLLAAEGGVGIHSSRDPAFEQDDLILYSASAELEGFRIVPSIAVHGQQHGRGHDELRGLEDLGELRAGLKAGNRTWARIELVLGYETFSPASGVVVSMGIRR